MSAEAIVAEIQAFLERNRNVWPLRESLPSRYRLLAEDGADPAVAVPLLMELLRCTGSYAFSYGDGRNAYAGQDLQMQVGIVRALGDFGADASSALPWLERTRCQCRSSRAEAVPGASPDPDKFDRDLELGQSQDELASACDEAIGRIRHGGARRPHAPPAPPAAPKVSAPAAPVSPSAPPAPPAVAAARGRPPPPTSAERVVAELIARALDGWRRVKGGS